MNGIKKIITIEAGDFLCPDTTYTVSEYDKRGRIWKSTRHRNGLVLREQEFFTEGKPELFRTSILILPEDNPNGLPEKLITYYDYDNEDQLGLVSSKDVQGNIISKTEYTYNPDHSINVVNYTLVAEKESSKKPAGTIDSLHYFHKDNLVKTIRIYPDGKRKNLTQGPIIAGPVDVSTLKNNEKVVHDSIGSSKIRTVYNFNNDGFILRNEGFMKPSKKIDGSDEEFRVYTIINEYEYYSIPRFFRRLFNRDKRRI